MKTGLCILLLFLTWLTADGQSDSVKVGRPEYDFLYRELFNFDPASTFGGLTTGPAFSQQSFNLHDTPVYRLNDNRQFVPGVSLLTTPRYFLFHPLVQSFFIQHAASYRLNNNMTLSGSSFLGNSVFNPFPSATNLNKMDLRGTSFFLDYKVSKNFHIGGGISVTNGY